MPAASGEIDAGGLAKPELVREVGQPVDAEHA